MTVKILEIHLGEYSEWIQIFEENKKYVNIIEEEQRKLLD